MSGGLKIEPFWWENLTLPDGENNSPAEVVDIVVVGSGYTGLSCAVTLARGGKKVALFERDRFGAGASTRSGGQVSGGVTLGKSAAGRYSAAQTDLARRQLQDASDAMTYLEKLIAEEKIDCDYHRTGRVIAAWTYKHLEQMHSRILNINTLTAADASMLSRQEIADELGSDYYLGGMLVKRAGHLNPGKLHAGLLKLAASNGVLCYDHCAVTAYERKGSEFLVKTRRGNVRAERIVMATNAYTGPLDEFLNRQIIPIASHVVATKSLPVKLANTIIPKDRSVSENRRVLNYYRKSPDGKRLILGGRTRFFPISPETSARLLRQTVGRIFPQLQDIRISHCWQGNVALTFDSVPRIGIHDGVDYCVGCNGSGITLMTYLGHLTATKLLSGTKEPICSFDDDNMPSSKLYRGRTWFLPLAGTGFQLRDAVDRQLATLQTKAGYTRTVR